MSHLVNNVAKAALVITVISAFSKVFGLIRESALAAYFGASVQSDAYKLALSIPMNLLALLSLAIATTFIPVYSEFLKTKTKEETNYFLNNIFNILVLVSILLTIVAMIASSLIISAIAPGFSSHAHKLTVKLTLLVLPCLAFNALFTLGSGYLQSHNKFVIPAVAGVVFDMVVIGSMFLFHNKGIEWIAIASVIGVAIQFVIQIPLFFKLGFKFMPVVNFKEEGFKKIASLTIPVLISSAFIQLYIFIDRMLASGLDAGSISALDYANRINMIVFGVFVVSIVTSIYPKLALLSDDTSKFTLTLAKGIKAVGIVSFPTMAGFFVLRVPIINVLLERGVFDRKSTMLTAIALAGFSLGFIGVALRELLNKAFYSLKDTSTPMKNGIIALILNILLDLILVRIWGVGGLALATAFSAIISTIMLLFRLKRRIGFIRGKEISVTYIKSILASGVMGLAIYAFDAVILNNILNSSAFFIRCIRLLSNVSFGGILYILIIYFLKVEEVRIALEIILSKIRTVKVRSINDKA